jgi:hypothetical protein
MMEDLAGAKVQSDALRSKYPDDAIGVIAKILIRDPLTSAERQMISKGSPSPPITGVAKAGPVEYMLYQNNPNPFNPTTAISFHIPNRENVELVVFDFLGRKIATLADGDYSPGLHSVRFDGSFYPAGVYLYRMRAGSYLAVKKLILLK